MIASGVHVKGGTAMLARLGGVCRVSLTTSTCSTRRKESRNPTLCSKPSWRSPGRDDRSEDALQVPAARLLRWLGSNDPSVNEGGNFLLSLAEDFAKDKVVVLTQRWSWDAC